MSNPTAPGGVVPVTQPKSPVSPKVANGTLSGLVLTLLTGALENYIPAWHSGIPSYAQFLIAGALGAAGYFGAGYLSKHKATATEIENALKDVEGIASVVMAHQQTALGNNVKVSP